VKLKVHPRKQKDMRFREFPPDGDFAAEIRKKYKNVLRNQRCDRCRLIGFSCTKEFDGCQSCKKIGARCTVTDLRHDTTYVRGVSALPPLEQIQNNMLENRIKDLTKQIFDLKSYLKYDSEAQALNDLRQENERLRAENERYRSMSMSTTAVAAAAFQTEESRLTRPSSMLADAPFATQQLDLGGNPYTPAAHADITNDRAGTTANPITLPTWAQPAPGGYVADPGYIPGVTNAFSGPAAEPLQGYQETQSHGYPGLAIDPGLLADPTAREEGQELVTQPFLDFVSGDEQANKQASANDFNSVDAGNYPNEEDVVDDDTLFHDIMWDQ
jgi:hypothetical protein